MGSEGGEDLSVLDLPVDQRPPAPIHRRIGARVIDVLTVLCVLWAAIVMHIFWFIGPLAEDHQPDPWGGRFVTTVAFVALWMLYEWAFLVYSKGQTPGKDIMKLRVISTGGSPEVGSAQALLRWTPLAVLPWIAPVWAVPIALAAVALPLVGRRRRAVHEVVSRTRVVAFDRDREDPSARRPKPRWRRRKEEREESELSESIAGRGL